jgi:hypothetical protein
MSRYLVRADSSRWTRGSGRNVDLVYAKLPFSCYTSRPDRVGWDFHCTTDFRSHLVRWVDVGAGRRGRLCRLRDARRCPPG